jgi:hypothetical protein
MRFIVERREIWVQLIEVDAESLEEAIAKAEIDEGILMEDPRFKEFAPTRTWKAEEKKET